MLFRSQKAGNGSYRSNLAQSFHPTPNLYCQNRVKEGVWQVVQRKDKGKKIVEGVDLDVSTNGSNQRLEANNKVRSTGLEEEVARSSEHVILYQQPALYMRE